MLKYPGTSKLNKTDFLPLKFEVNRTSDKKIILIKTIGGKRIFSRQFIYWLELWIQ